MIGRAIAVLVLLAGVGPLTTPQAMAQTVADDAPAGNYALDLAHGRLMFRVSHLGFSRYTALFTRFDAALVFDPAAPETMSVTATVDVASLETHYPDASFDFNTYLTGPDFLDAATYPQMTFASTKLRQTGPQTAELTGDLTLRGVTKPVTLNVTFNGGYAGHPLDAGARIGFSGEGSLLRSDFGMTAGIPAPGTTMGVGDQVEVMIEAEFLNPDAPKVLE